MMNIHAHYIVTHHFFRFPPYQLIGTWVALAPTVDRLQAYDMN